MAPVVVQRAQDFSGSGTDITATFGTDPVAGNMLIAVYKNNSTTAITTLPAGWAWATGTPYAAGTSRVVGIAYKVAEAADTTAVTFTTDLIGQKALAIVEVSGADTPATPVLTSVAGGSVTSKTLATTGTLPKADCYVIAVAEQASNNGGEVSVNSGFTLRHASFANNMMVADKITTVDTALAPTLTWTTARASFGLQAVFPMPDAAPAAGADVYYYDGAVWVDCTLTVQ